MGTKAGKFVLGVIRRIGRNPEAQILNVKQVALTLQMGNHGRLKTGDIDVAERIC